MTTNQEVRDRFAKYVEQERRAEAAGFLPPSGTGSNVYTRGAADVDHDEEAELRRLESGAEPSSASIFDPARPDAAAPLPQAPSEQQHSPPAALKRRKRWSASFKPVITDVDVDSGTADEGAGSPTLLRSADEWYNRMFGDGGMFGVGASSAANSIAVPAEQPTDAITANPEQAATTANASFINTLAPQSVISATSVAAATTIPAAKPAPATVAAAPSDGSTASAAATSTIGSRI